MTENQISSRAKYILKTAVATGFQYGIVGVAIGAIGGALIGGIYEYMTSISGGNGPLAFIWTGPIGFLAGLGHGFWKEMR